MYKQKIIDSSHYEIIYKYPNKTIEKCFSRFCKEINYLSLKTNIEVTIILAKHVPRDEYKSACYIGNNTIAFLSDAMCWDKYDEELIVMCATHEFAHIMIDNKYIDIENFSTKICSFVLEAIGIGKEFEYEEMMYLYRNLIEYKKTNKINYAIEVVCELMSHSLSPVRNEIFKILDKGSYSSEELLDIKNKIINIEIPWLRVIL